MSGQEPKPVAQPAGEDGLSAEERAFLDQARKDFPARRNLPKASRKLQDRMQSEAGDPDE
jgi:hypothetical protein